MKSRHSIYPYRIRKSDADKMPAIPPEKLKQMKKDVEKYLPRWRKTGGEFWPALKFFTYLRQDFVCSKCGHIKHKYSISISFKKRHKALHNQEPAEKNWD